MSLSISISTRLAHQHTSLPIQVTDLTDWQLKTRLNPDKWSVFEQIAHLAAYQPVFLTRLQQILDEDTPAFNRYVAEQDPDFPIYLDMTAKDLLAAIAKKGTMIAEELQKWQDSALERKGLHPKYGLLDVSQWAEFYLLHEAHHLFAIFMMTQDLRNMGLQ